MQTVIIFLTCLVALVILWYVELLDFFEPKDLSLEEDEASKQLEKDMNSFTKT